MVICYGVGCEVSPKISKEESPPRNKKQPLNEPAASTPMQSSLSESPNRKNVPNGGGLEDNKADTIHFS